VVTPEIRNRGTHDVLIAVVDGLKGFPEAINAVAARPKASPRGRYLAQNHVYGEDDDAYPANDKRYDYSELKKSPIPCRVLLPCLGISNGSLPLFDGGRIVHMLTSSAQNSSIRFRQIAFRCFDQRQTDGSGCSGSAR
jgi:hypothetical protein